MQGDDRRTKTNQGRSRMVVAGMEFGVKILGTCTNSKHAAESTAPWTLDARTVKVTTPMPNLNVRNVATT